MRGRIAAAVVACAVLLSGCASTVAGAGFRASTDGGSTSASTGGTAVSTPSSAAGPVGSDGPSGQSSVRPMPPLGSSGGPSSASATGGPGRTTAAPSTSTSSAPSTPTAPKTGETGRPTASADPAAEFDGASAVDPSTFPGRVTDVGFASPSGNITCGISGGIVVCQIDTFDYTPPKHDCGPSGWGFNFKLESKSAFLFCAGDVESGGPTLDYGRQITVGKVRCVSRQDGVTCQNTGTGYGFRLARAEYVFFGPNEAPTTVGTSAATGIPPAVVGQWQGHGRLVTIAAGGKGTLDYRAYQFCSDDPTPPCDKTTGNAIVDGGHIEFALTASSGSKAATGKVTASNDPKTPVGTPVTATVSGYNLMLSFWPDTPFCAANTPADKWNCGA